MSESSASSLSDEQIINRWGFDYYVFKAFAAFRDGDYAGFTHFTRIVESLVLRPVDGHSDMIVKLRFMQFLSRINNGDKLDLSFEEPQTPLESALSVLDSICRDMSVPEREQEQVRHAIAETLIVVCIRSGEFEKAEEVLLKHFSDAADSAGKRKLLLNLIRRRRSSHSVLQLSSFTDFKQDMLDFIERLYRVPEPFLLQMLKRSGHHGLTSDPVPSSHHKKKSSSAPAAEDHGSRARLRLRDLQQVYAVLRERYAVSVSFAQLQQQIQEEEEDSDPELHLTLSETQDTERERDAPSYAGMTISRLVLEDDSQISAEEEEETQISSPHRVTPDHPQLLTSSPPPDTQTLNSETSSSPAHRSRRSHTHQRTLLSSDVESEDPPESSRRSSRHKQQKKSDVSESECMLMKARLSSPSVRHSDTGTQSSAAECEDHSGSPTHTQQQQKSEDTHSRECVTALEEPGSADQISSPARPGPSDTREHSRSVSVSSESEDHSSSPSSAGAHSKRKRARWEDVSGTQENWSDEETLFSSTSGHHSKKGSRKKWTWQESEWLKEGVRRYGVGHWEKIRSSFPFSGRTAVNLKDRWRTMTRLRLV